MKLLTEELHAQLVANAQARLADLTAAFAAQGRAQSIEAARQAAAEEEGRERFRRFRKKN